MQGLTCNVLHSQISVSVAYSVGYASFERCETVKDLGVCFDYHLIFTHHVNTAAALARSMLGCMIRNYKLFTNAVALRAIYVVCMFVHICCLNIVPLVSSASSNF